MLHSAWGDKPALPQPLLSLPECAPGADSLSSYRPSVILASGQADGRMANYYAAAEGFHPPLFRCLRRAPATWRPASQSSTCPTAPAAATWRSATWACYMGYLSSCASITDAFGMRSARACLLANTPARAFTCLRKPCAPDPVGRGGVGCSTGACVCQGSEHALLAAHRHATGKSLLIPAPTRRQMRVQWSVRAKAPKALPCEATS